MRKFEKDFYGGSMMKVIVETTGNHYSKPTKTSVEFHNLGGMDMEFNIEPDNIKIFFEGYAGIENLKNGMIFAAECLQKVLEDS